MRRLIALALVFASCSGATVTTTAGDPAGVDLAPVTSTTVVVEATSTTTSSLPPPAPNSDEIYADALDVAANPNGVTISLLATAMGESGDPRWIPYLVDLVALVVPGEPATRITEALATLTGQAPPEDPTRVFTQYGSWAYDAGIDAGDRYVDWKANLFTLIDPRFGPLLAQVEDPVLASRILWGGVARGGIPELNDSPAITVDAAGHMTPDELTFGAVLGGEARAYPHRILDHHELANDTLGGEPVALANCTLCRTGILFSRIVDGQVLDFETSGLLMNSNKVMVDRQTNTLWEQLTGVAIAGPLAGAELDRHFLTVTTYGDWVAEHPDTDVLDIPDGPYSYQPGDAYAGYYATQQLWFPTFGVPDTFEPKAEMATLELDGVRLAVEIATLQSQGPQVLEVGGARVAVFPTTGGARFYAVGAAVAAGDLPEAVASEESLTVGGAEYSRLQSGQSFWFAWYGTHPDTGWWPQDG